MIPRTRHAEVRIRVWSGANWNQGSPKITLTPDNGLMSLDALNTTPAGDSLDGTFTLDPAGLNIAPRDTITVDVRETIQGIWVPRYAGIITTASNPRSEDRQTIRVTGIRQRMFETITQTGYLDAGDVAAQVRSILNQAIHRPTGTTYASADVPDLGFELGPRATAYETVGDFLDAMAGFVGAFVVPTGQTYTYDGHTYQPGETVPPVAWGIRPDGSIYFRRPAPTPPAEFRDGDQRTDIDWQPISAEDATGDILLTYLGALNTEDVDFERMTFTDSDIPDNYYDETTPALVMVQPIARIHGRLPLTQARTPTHATRVQIDGPLDLMEPLPLSDMTAIPGTGITNPNHAVDGDPDTYAELTDPIAELTIIADADYDGVWKIVYSMDHPEGVSISTRARIGLDLPAPAVRFASAVTQSRMRGTNGEKRTIYLPAVLTAALSAPFRDPWTLTGPKTLWFYRTTSLDASSSFHFRIYEVEYLVPDCDLGTTDAERDASRSARYADAHRRVPAPEVARITYHGFGPTTHELKITPHTGPSIQAWTERITLAATPTSGITTTYHAGQQWPAQVQEQRILLERLARRSVQDGGRRR